MAKSKLELALYYFYDHTAMEAHFEKMAMKGWALDRMGIFWHYRKIPPQKLHYAVAYFPGGGFYRPATEGEQTFSDYCESAGWEFVAEFREIKIFCNESKDAVPLETQADVQVENIHNASRKTRISYGILGILGWLIVFYFLIGFFTDGAGTLSSGMGLVIFLCALCLGVFTIYDFVNYQIWYKKARTNAARDMSFTPTRGNQVLLKLAVLIPLAGGVMTVFFGGGLLYLCFIGGFFVVYYIQDWIRNWLRKKGAQTIVNVIVNFLIAFLIFFSIILGYGNFSSGHSSFSNYGFAWDGATLPLTMQDILGENNFSGRGYITPYSTKSSIFLSQMSAEQFPEENISGTASQDKLYMQYVLTKVHFHTFYNFTRDSMLKTYGEKKMWESIEDWGGSKGEGIQAFKLSLKQREMEIFRYLICMEDRVLKIDVNFPLDFHQQEIIQEKLEKP